MKATIAILASAELAPHVNRLPFTGTLTYIDKPSDRPPSGARGRRVILTKQAAESALHTLIGMAIDYCPGWDGHDARRKVGIITDAQVVDGHIDVNGYLFARDFPEILRMYQGQGKGKWGMSYEIADAHIEDMRASVWRITDTIFTGAAILDKDKAAYGETSFELLSGGLNA